MAQLLAAKDRRALTKMNSVIALSFLLGGGCAFVPGKDLYDELFAKLGRRLRAIITPNYDLLVAGRQDPLDSVQAAPAA
jgi:hypothetical protein